jgi:preprotein translocase subunit SecG
MAEEQEKDNTWLIAGVAIAAVIVLVVMLKQDETKHLQSGAVAQSQAEVFKKVEARHTSNNTGNVGN